MEGFLTMYVLPHTAKHLAHKKWFCLEKNSTALQYARGMHQIDYDESILQFIYKKNEWLMLGISLDESYCRLALNDVKSGTNPLSLVLC